MYTPTQSSLVLSLNDVSPCLAPLRPNNGTEEAGTGRERANHPSKSKRTGQNPGWAYRPAH
ncbi:hypothetical protein THAOC_04276, partial [Thalassiosira oceanica]